MAFELKDFFRNYTSLGDRNGVFNAVRDDMDSSVERYYAYMNEEGSYIIQQQTTAGTTTQKVYKYYGKRKSPATFAADWTGRTGLTYGEYHALFSQE